MCRKVWGVEILILNQVILYQMQSLRSMQSRTGNAVVSFTTMMLITACGGKQPPPVQPSAVPVTVEEVKSTEAVYYDEFPGTVVALNQT
jgi:membrane fusion protein (multidrug efflux system)